HRLTFQRLEIFFSRSASRRAADALALVHAETSRRNFGVRFSQKRIVTARFQNSPTRWIERKVAVLKQKSKPVPNQPPPPAPVLRKPIALENALDRQRARMLLAPERLKPCDGHASIDPLD